MNIGRRSLVVSRADMYFYAAMVRRLTWNAASEGFLPEWVEKWANWREVETHEQDLISLDYAQADANALLCARLAAADRMNAGELEAATAAAYETIFRRLDAIHPRHPVRFWNFVPDIHRHMDDSRDRYMVFNGGRFAAFERYYAGQQAFDQRVATASAVGHNGTDLVILCLSRLAPGLPVDNPRQIKAYCYSPRFGPRPPCFARAMVVNDEPHRLLLAGGTASIVGEESAHAGDLRKQFDETLANLAALVKEASADQFDDASALNLYRELRVYHPRKEDEPVLQQWVRQAMPNVRRLEMRQANLCRTELLVEIEGVAELSGVQELAPALHGHSAPKTSASSRTPYLPEK